MLNKTVESSEYQEKAVRTALVTDKKNREGIVYKERVLLVGLISVSCNKALLQN